MRRRGFIFIMPIFLLAWFFVLSGVAKAAILTIETDTVWTKVQSPMVVNNYIWLKPGVNLTIEKGVVIKHGPGGMLIVSGKLTALGTKAEPIIFTSIKDDANGGDTNGDGAASAPAPGDWWYLNINSGGEANLDYVTIQYGGSEYFQGGLINYKGKLIINDSIITKNNAGIGNRQGVIAINNSSIMNNLMPFDGGVFVDSAIGNNAQADIIVNATNNWWGTTQGPCVWRQLIPPGMPIWQIDIKALCGDKPLVDLGVNYTPWLMAPPDESVEFEPVIIVPGVMGSYLNRDDVDKTEVWPNILKMLIPGDDSYLNELAMEANGYPNLNNPMITSTDIMRKIFTNDYFQGLITELTNNGYEEGKNLFVFPYDWRWFLNWSAGEDPFLAIQSLKEKIDAVKTQTGAQKVNIVAHSMGGLVAKYYIKHYGSDSVDKFIDIGTPHLGAPGAFKTLMYGDNIDIWFLNPNVIKTISQNFPSVYELLPSRNYFDSSNPNYAYYIYDMYDLDNNGIKNRLDYDQSIDFMKNTGRNNYLLGYNDIFHNDLDNYSPKSDGIKTYNIMGCGQPTIGQIFVLNKEKSGGYEYGLKYISGDSTVPLRSAEALIADNSYYIKGVEHSSLPSANGIKQITTAILKDTISSFSLQNYPAISRDSVGCSLTGTQISFHSPIDLNVYDENNNHVGPNQNGDIEMGIVGAQYDNLDGNKFVFLPEGHNYRIVGQATASGTFNARVQTIVDGQYTQTAYYNEVPLNSSSTVAKLQINSGQPTGAMELDQNGDQIFETTVEPSAVLNQEEGADLVKPETQIEISGTAGNDNYYISTTTATLIATDNQGGSGILKTEFSLDNGLTWQNYENPIIFNHDGEYNILYKSTDRAGNIEEEKAQKLKIDMITPVINVLLPLETQEFTRDELFTPEYEVADSYSGIATSSLAVLIDGQPISQSEQNLFYYSLGEHVLKITVRDLAGNQAETSVKFMVNADLDSVISDVNRSDALGWIKDKTAEDWIIKKLNQIKDYEAKFGEKENSFILIKYQDILKQLGNYYKKQWLNESAYDIIKADINYLINNL